MPEYSEMDQGKDSVSTSGSELTASSSVKADRRSSTECPLEFRIGLFGNTFLFLTIALSLRAAAGCLKYHFN